MCVHTCLVRRPLSEDKKFLKPDQINDWAGSYTLRLMAAFRHFAQAVLRCRGWIPADTLSLFITNVIGEADGSDGAVVAVKKQKKSCPCQAGREGSEAEEDCFGKLGRPACS